MDVMGFRVLNPLANLARKRAQRKQRRRDRVHPRLRRWMRGLPVGIDRGSRSSDIRSMSKDGRK